MSRMSQMSRMSPFSAMSPMSPIARAARRVATRQCLTAWVAAAGLAAALMASSAGCGIDPGVGGGDDDGDDDSSVGCAMSFGVSPTQPQRGDELQLTADIDEGELAGFHEYHWTVRRSGAPLALTGADLEILELTAPESGVYLVELTGSVGGEECTPAVQGINVLEPGALSRSFRLRAIPPEGDATSPPPQDLDVELFGGAGDYALGAIGLRPGQEVSGVSRGPDGAPVAAYLRVRRIVSLDPPLYSETFAGDDGSYRLRLTDEDYELLVVPDDPALPAYRRDRAAADDLAGLTQAPPGDVFSVSVTSGAGGADPVAGARVSLVIGGVPSSVAITDAGGQASLRLDADRAHDALSVTVVPPAGAGLPQLELPASSGVELAAGGGDIAVRYLASLTSRSVAPDVRRADGTTPAAGSRVTWIARPIDSAGTISIGGAPHQATGVVRVTALVGDSGAAAAALVPEAIYDALVEPPVDAPRDTDATSATEVDLRAGSGQPAPLRLAAPARLRGQVLAPAPRQGGGAAEPIAGVRVETSPRSGVYLGAPLAGASTVTDDEGRFTLLVAGGGDYEIAIDGASRRQGRVLVDVTSPAPGAVLELDPIELPRVLRATGVLSVASGGARLAGAHLQLFCHGCGPQERSVPMAEALTDDDGGFVLLAPDPGVTPTARP
ncbi:MAG TPA: hypothetical protein VKB80_05735 [Kofleriaceae bacterium]|nr:hypothetical protein [Kofleriaceae bacterium]